MNQIELSVGTIDYHDTGQGPTIVLLKGFDGRLPLERRDTDLSADHWCVAPTLPGAHHHPMRLDAALSLPGIARPVAEFLDHLDLRDVTLIGNDTDGALVQLLACDDPARLGRIVLASCDAFDNFPPRRCSGCWPPSTPHGAPAASTSSTPSQPSDHRSWNSR